MPSAPDLPGVVAAFNAAGAAHVVIGGFAVVANRHVRATEDVDLLIPQNTANSARVMSAVTALDAVFLSDGASVSLEQVQTRPHLRLDCAARGVLDLLREGEPPLDFASVDAGAIKATVEGVPMRFAGLSSIVAFKRLADRPRDRNDLLALEEIHGALPILAIPGLDDEAT